MIIHILVEGSSERAFLEPWTQRLLPGSPVKVHPHLGKGRLPKDLAAAPERHHRGLLDQLPATLRGFAGAPDVVLVVLVDADDEDPNDLRTTIGEAARTLAPKLPVLVQIAVEETEAFYLGDKHAIRRGYPDADLSLLDDYAPDSIVGAWELFGKVIGDDGGNKMAWAGTMGPLLTTDPARSRSPSFRAFLRALRDSLPAPGPKPKRRRWRHEPRTSKRRR